MKVLVIGKGGREHALVRALHHSPSVTEVHACPGSSGMSKEAICHKDISDLESLSQLVKSTHMDLVVVGPENELVEGWSNYFRERGVPVVGPSKEAALLEGSKVFAKEFMAAAGVPTSRYFVVSTVEETLKAAQNFKPPYVLKADGLAAGKGVHICKDLADLEASAQFLFLEKGLGEAGSKALLEEFQSGWELSYLVLTNGESSQTLPLAQDHKRLSDGDKGPNTGGMGVVAPLNISSELRAQIEKEIVEPSILELKKRKLLYRGVLYIGLMITEEGPRVIEYNVRFGDPEAQVILPLLEGDWGKVFKALAEGELLPLKWKNLSMACVVLAAEGYPGLPQKGVTIEGNPEFETESSYFLHAGTKYTKGEGWTVDGGRVLNAIGIGSDLKEALERAYQQAEKAQWPRQEMRRDIGLKLL